MAFSRENNRNQKEEEEAGIKTLRRENSKNKEEVEEEEGIKTLRRENNKNEKGDG